MNISKRVKAVEEKYNLYIDISNIISNEVERYLLYRIGSCSKVAIAGAGRDAIRLIDKFASAIPVTVLFDNEDAKQGTFLKNIPIKKYDESFSDYKIVVGSFDYKNEIKMQLRECGVEESNLIDVWDFLQNNGLSSWIENVYTPAILLNNCYNGSKSETEKTYLLQIIIKYYWTIKDFPSLFRYIDKYIDEEREGFDKYRSCKREIETLINCIRDKIHNDDRKNIIWFWQDALLYSFGSEMPFFRAIKNESLFLTNAYASSVWTRCVYELIFNKKYEIDDRSYQHEKEEKLPIVEKLQTKGYRCIRMCEDRAVDIDDFDFANDKILSFDIATSKLYWNGLETILNTHDPILLLMHMAYECHQPNCCPNLKQFDPEWSDLTKRNDSDTFGKYKENVLVCLDYLNSVTEFYSTLLGERNIKIFMSDHGAIQNRTLTRFSDDAMHMFFMVMGKEIEHGIFDGMFCLEKFEELIDYLLDPSERNLEKIFMDEIKIQGCDVYNKNTIISMIQAGMAEYCVSFRGIQTKNDKYILLKNGKEFYWRNNIEEINFIDDANFQNRIAYLRRKTGDNFIEAEDDEKFIHTKLLYDYLDQANLD